MQTGRCEVLLKEWAVTCRALEEGRQVVLLRKGGILDEEGVFALEHREFWLLPTYEHQDTTLVQPAHRDLFQFVDGERPASRFAALIGLFAEVTAVYPLGLDEQERLPVTAHIWSTNYLDLRFGYKPERPLLAVVLRVYRCDEPHRIMLRESDLGCRSWCVMDTALETGLVRPVLSDVEFARQAENVRLALGGAGAAVASTV